MKSLWLKDRPWMLTFAVVGAIGLGLANTDGGFIRLFVTGPHQLEVLFYGAGGCALLLGIVAALWDDILGTREFLMQRPVSRKALFRSRMLACGLVLASWMISVPLVTWMLAAFSSGIYDLTFWAGLPEILSTLQIVWPMCTVGVLASTLPTTWWLRLVSAALLTVAVGVAIYLGAAGPLGMTTVLGFAFACWLPVVILFPLAAGMNAQHADPDRPWLQRTRLMAGTVLVASLTYIVGGAAREGQTHALRSLHWEYPRIVLIDDAIKLAVRHKDWSKLAVADKAHVSTGQARKRDDFRMIAYDSRRVPELFEIRAPRFHRFRAQDALTRDGRVYVGQDGRAWFHLQEAGEVRRIGIGPELANFPLNVRPRNIDDVGAEPNREEVVVGDRASGKLWRFDRNQGHFVAWPLPGGDEFQEVSYVRSRDWLGATNSPSDLLSEALAHGNTVSGVEGGAHSYLLHDGEWVVVDVPRRGGGQPAQRKITPVLHGDDLVAFSVEVPANDGRLAFRHDFEPRTLAELGYAANAMALTAVRPPLTQALNHLFASDRSEASIWQDRVICGGKRTWLLLSGMALSIGCALLMRRRLRRIGVDASACRFWFVATVVAGPVTALLPLVLESARNHARPEVKAPPAPRITSVRDYEEIRA